MRFPSEPTPLSLAMPHLSASSDPEAPPPVAEPALAAQTQQLPGLTSSLFVQAFSFEAAGAAPLIAHAGVGVVYTLEHKGYRSHFQAAAAAVHDTCRGAPGADILIDRNRYSGKNRADATSAMSRQWAEDQLRGLGLPWALGDAGYAASLVDVSLVLQQGRALPACTIVPLAIPHQLLRDDAASLLALINDQDKPVALIVEHESDPFGTGGVVAGLVHVLRGAQVPVLLLRTDTSALGAISYGAAVGAVGAHSSLRHLFPVLDGNGGHGERLAFVVPALLTYVLADRFAKAYLVNPTLPAWRCGCWFCHGRDLTWIAASGKQAKAVAFQHSVASIADLGIQLRSNLLQMNPVAAWDLMVTTAQTAHFAVANPSGSPWAPQDFLAHWHHANGSGQRVP